MANKKILVISDMHLPYQHKDSITFLKEIKKEFKPDRIVNIGDLLDFHAISMHEHNPDLYSPGHELEQAKKHVKELEKIFPKMVLVHSNHSSLVYRRALKYGLPKAYLKHYNEFLGVGNGWIWVDDHTITLSDGTPLWFPAPIIRSDGQLDRANNYSTDATWARVIGFNLKRKLLIANGIY